MNEIKWTIYWTKKPGRGIVDPPERDSGYSTSDINKAFENLPDEYDQEWAGFVDEWCPNK